MAKTTTIPERAVFLERDGWVYYIANWQERFTQGGRAVLVRLSPRHFVRYQELKERGRSQKSIAYLLFKHRAKPAPAARAAKAPGAARTVPVSIDILTPEQLYALICEALGVRIPGLRALTLAELRKLYLALGAGHG